MPLHPIRTAKGIHLTTLPHSPNIRLLPVIELILHIFPSVRIDHLKTVSVVARDDMGLGLSEGKGVLKRVGFEEFYYMFFDVLVDWDGEERFSIGADVPHFDGE